MGFEHYIHAQGRRLRCGYTTGTCAALAAAGAAELLLSRRAPERVALTTPAGLRVEAETEGCALEGKGACCGVRKDGGDDIDVTSGLLICARAEKRDAPGVSVLGGRGVGRVTRPGLDQPVGEAAINRVPRQMICQGVEEVCRRAGYAGGVEVVISVPGGEELARRTFNPRLGILGGISILGTGGIVEPMSLQALADTVALELRQAAALGAREVVLTPGNYGEEFLRGLGMPPPGVGLVKCSNFIGQALDEAGALGFERVLLVGHVGKLVKLAGGIMNTHSRWGDCRNELFCAHAALQGASREVCRQLMEAATSQACLSILAYGSLAYFTAEDAADNVITAGNIDIALKETAIPEGGGDPVPFVDLDGVMPGAEASKIVQVENTGDHPAYVRVRLEKTVTLAEGVDGEADASLVALDINTDQWTLRDGYYYYSEALAPGETTAPLFTTVRFAAQMDDRYQNSKTEIAAYAGAVQAENNGGSALDAAGWPAE